YHTGAKFHFPNENRQEILAPPSLHRYKGVSYILYISHTFDTFGYNRTIDNFHTQSNETAPLNNPENVFESIRLIVARLDHPTCFERQDKSLTGVDRQSSNPTIPRNHSLNRV